MIHYMHICYPKNNLAVKCIIFLVECGCKGGCANEVVNFVKMDLSKPEATQAWLGNSVKNTVEHIETF